jgi:hypothetical protein
MPGRFCLPLPDSLDRVWPSTQDKHMKKLILILLFGCTACTTQAHDPAHPVASAKQAPPAAADTLGKIRAMIGDAACSENKQCRTLAVGARACGGPETYLAYSTAKTSEAELRALAERHQQERRDANTASGMISTCQFMVDPGAVCQAGRCQAGGGEAPVR